MEKAYYLVDMITSGVIAICTVAALFKYIGIISLSKLPTIKL